LAALSTRFPLMISSTSSRCRTPRNLHSFPTRRSSDLRRFLSQTPIQCHLVIGLFTSNLKNTSRARGKDLDLGTRRFSNFPSWIRSEEHTSELQSRENLVCRRLLEKQKTDRHVCHA